MNWRSSSWGNWSNIILRRIRRELARISICISSGTRGISSIWRNEPLFSWMRCDFMWRILLINIKSINQHHLGFYIAFPPHHSIGYTPSPLYHYRSFLMTGLMTKLMLYTTINIPIVSISHLITCQIWLIVGLKIIYLRFSFVISD